MSASTAPRPIGLIAALALAAGLRSGSRGGPIALEPAEVRYVLLAPVDRPRRAARPGAAPPALRVLRRRRRRRGGRDSSSCAGCPERRSRGSRAAPRLASSSPCSSSAPRCARRAGDFPSPAATILGALVIAWAALDLAEIVPAPTTTIGSIAIWPLRVHWIDLLGVVAVGVLFLIGLRSIGGVSVEFAERRTSLVGQLRFAVTVQDLRTVIVLRRQLAQDRPA